MKNFLLLFTIFNFGSKLQAQSGLTFNRVVVIDTTMAVTGYTSKFNPSSGYIWKVENAYNDKYPWGTTTGFKFIVNGKQIDKAASGNLTMNFPFWIDENSYIQFYGQQNWSFVISILEFKVD